tara:strand:+ start:1715 stop:1972 length:258 start_codon:yes stop_codon:yes gene_type:complete
MDHGHQTQAPAVEQDSLTGLATQGPAVEQDSLTGLATQAIATSGLNPIETQKSSPPGLAVDYPAGCLEQVILGRIRGPHLQCTPI